jgi:NADH-quinone oxidoreductase subunit J
MLNFEEILFLMSALLLFFSTSMLIFTKNIVHSCIFLLFTLLSVAGLFITLDADYLAIIQILVYVGGVVVLILFAVMLTGGQQLLDVKNKLSGKVSSMGERKHYVFGLLFPIPLLVLLMRVFMNEPAVKMVNSKVGHGTAQSTLEGMGTLLITDHVFSFEVISILLLGALVGAAVIARPKKSKLGAGK